MGVRLVLPWALLSCLPNFGHPALFLIFRAVFPLHGNSHLFSRFPTVRPTGGDVAEWSKALPC